VKPHNRQHQKVAFILFAALLLALGMSASAFAAGTVSEVSEADLSVKSEPNVLFLSSYSPDWFEVAMQMQGLQDTLRESANLQYVFMDTKHISEAEANDAAYKRLNILCGETKFSAVIVGDDAALDFTLKYRGAFFPDTPVVFMGINSIEKARSAAQQSLFTGTAEVFPLKETLSMAVSLRPKAGRVLAITDGTASSDGYLKQLEEIMRDFPGLTIENMDCSQLTRSEIASRLASCDENTILLYMIMSRDGEGNQYDVRQAVSFLSGAANIPIFKADEAGIGDGIFGGCVISYRQMGAQAGENVKEILNGTAPDEIEIKNAGTRYEFDYNQLRRFGIAASSLPTGSTIINTPATFWSENRQTLIPGIIIISTLLLMLAMSFWDGRKRAILQRKLADSQKLYRTASNSADLVVWEYVPSKRQIILSFDSDFTKHVSEVRGFPQVLENGPERQAAVMYEEDRPALLEMYRKLDAGAETAECQYGFPWEGVPAYRRAKATAVYDEKTRRRTVVCISTDITGERRMQALYEKELQYLHQTNDGTLTSKGHFDLTEGTVLEYQLLIDMGPAPIDSHDYDTLMQNFLDTLENEKDREIIRNLADRHALIKKYREGERHLSYRYRRAKRGHSPAWIHLQCNMFVSPDSGHIECFMYSYDVTEQELKNQIISKLIDFGYENMGFVYPETHAATVFLLNEPGISQKTVSTPDYDEELRLVLSKSNTLEDRQELFDALCIKAVTQQLAAAGTYASACSIRLPDGRISRKQFTFSWLDDKHDTFFSCMSDITAQFEAAQKQIQELSAARLTAVKASEAKSSFLSSMSHDLRTPLNGILGFTEIALKESDPAVKQQYLEKIKLSGDLLLSLISDTLDLSRIESGKMKLEPEDIDSLSFLQSILAAVSPAAEQKNINLIADVERCPCETIYVDRLKLQKVILNLLSNAIKYTPAGGTVRFSAESLDSSGSAMTGRITVEDDGIGISPEFLPQLYEPFAQEMRPEAANIQGTGLGLSIAKKIVDLMGGTIDVRSEVHKGTTFVVDLPILCGKTSAEEKSKTECAAVSLSGKHVLLVEDNYLNTEIATLLLKEKDVIVTSAEDGKAGVEKFAAASPGTFDAILMDIRMPVMNGYEATQAIRRMARRDAGSIPIIAMTADAFEEDLRRAKEAGMDDYLTKPVEANRVYAALSKALQR
jgi:signal transduction histidine kinase/ActR/RegA family two-component response regulator